MNSCCHLNVGVGIFFASLCQLIAPFNHVLILVSMLTPQHGLCGFFSKWSKVCSITFQGLQLEIIISSVVYLSLPSFLLPSCRNFNL